jgi:hypothetical protein
VVSDSTAKIVSGTPTSMGGAKGRLLGSMPLHAITSVHGEVGLRKRLVIELARTSAMV